ncbi:MAG: nucleotidyltransferase domain-containing protein [Gammaproteobacteria bacterium]|nr:nucleotidyltransferase domain-containing protein [Gammaproteobacteria bacterium]
MTPSAHSLGFVCAVSAEQALQIPILGTILPNMGKTKLSSDGETRLSIADALFTSTQQRVLGLIFGQPDRSFFASEIIARLVAGSGAVQRELKKLADSGLVTVSRVGNQKHYQANASAPVFAELCALMRKTVGLTEPLRQALAPALSEIELALVYGSVAKGSATAGSDVDLLLVSDSLTLERVYELLTPAEAQLGRSINPTLYTADEFRRRRRDGNTFLERVLTDATLVLHGQLRDDD